MCTFDRITRVPSNADVKHGVTSTAMQQQQGKQYHAQLQQQRDQGNPTTKLMTEDPCQDKSGSSSSSVSALSPMTYTALGIATSVLVTLFSLYLPFWVGSPEAAKDTYHLARFEYEADKHHFDITAWTYGTDYGLALTMLLWCASMLLQQNHYGIRNNNGPLVRHIWGLFGGYAVSTLAGALSHQHYVNIELRSTWHFRVLWTVCVGTVTLASSSMGSIASELVVRFAQQETPNKQRLPTVYVPPVFWQSYAIMTTLFAIFGWFSYQRPACDIFIAGITQFPSSFYIIWVLAKIGQQSPHLLRASYTYIGMLSFIANAPLLPIYPLFVQYTSMNLAQVNTFLHSWLFISWSMQAFAMRHVRQAVLCLQERPAKAVPLYLGATNNGVAAKKDA